LGENKSKVGAVKRSRSWRWIVCRWCFDGRASIGLGQGPFLSLEQDARRGTFEIVVLAVPQRPHEGGKRGKPHPDCDWNKKEIVDHVAVPRMRYGTGSAGIVPTSIMV
jgi:hypothetical protein